MRNKIKYIILFFFIDSTHDIQITDGDLVEYLRDDTSIDDRMKSLEQKTRRNDSRLSPYDSMTQCISPTSDGTIYPMDPNVEDSQSLYY